MILIVLMVMSESELDLVAGQLGANPPFETVISMNNEYLRHDAFDKAISLLRTYENTYADELQAKIEYALAEDYFYSSNIINARNKYLSMAQRHPGSVEANDALLRLYQIEGMRSDTAIMKKIMYAICLLETDRCDAGKDSLLKVVDSELGDHAHYFLAQVYRRLGNLSLALSALLTIENRFTDCRIVGLPILKAEIYIDGRDYEKARAILEAFLIQDPVSIFAVKARQLLNKMPT